MSGRNGKKRIVWQRGRNVKYQEAAIVIYQAPRTVRGEGEPKARSSCTNREGIGEMREQR